MLQKLSLAGAALLLAVSPVYAADLVLHSLDVNKTLKAGKPYTVKLPYTKTGDMSEVKGCFLWSGEGPYCFPVEVRTKTIRAKLRTKNPNTYKLEGFAKYKSGGKLKSSNRVSATIVVQ